MKRGFKIVSSKKDQDIHLPQRQTTRAAGYDFEASEDFVLPSIWKPYLAPTGIKAYMQPDEFLLLANRSSGPFKRRLILPNGIGIVDADYYDNDSNEGEIFFQLINYGLRDYHIKKGERIGQGIFMPYLTADSEEQPTAKRTGGFGSTKE